MKTIRFSILMDLFVFLSSMSLSAQTGTLEKISPAAYGSQYPLMVGTAKTTVLVFPEKIAAGGVDLGSTDIIANTISGVDNILRVKAATENFTPTNLTVVTTDGKIYSFYVSFSDYPDDRPIDLGRQQTEEQTQAALQDRILNDAGIRTCSDAIITRKPFLKKPHAQSYGIKMSLRGIYIKEDVLFFRLELKNSSPIDFSTDFSRFYIRDKKRLKRTADQEQELTPLLSCPKKEDAVASGATQTIVIAFKRFTIADHKNFVVQLFEKNGDRHLELKIDGKKLMQAQKI